MDASQSGSGCTRSSHASVTTVTCRKIINGKRFRYSNGDKKTFYFSTANDIPLLKTCIQLNPWANNNWDEIVTKMMADFGCPISLRQIRERVGKLVKHFKTETLHEINTTGGQAQINERTALIEECASLMDGTNSEILTLYTDEIPTNFQLETKVENLERDPATRLTATSPSTVSDDSMTPVSNSLISKRFKKSDEDYDLMKLRLESEIEFKRMEFEMEEKKLHFQQELEERRLKLEEQRLEFEKHAMEQRVAENIANRNFQITITELIMDKMMTHINIL